MHGPHGMPIWLQPRRLTRQPRWLQPELVSMPEAIECRGSQPTGRVGGTRVHERSWSQSTVTPSHIRDDLAATP
jgi:hypothetical protein